MKARMKVKPNGQQTTVREAAELAGYSTNDAQLHRLSHNPHMQAWMRNMLTDAGITEADILRVFKDAMTAEKVSRAHYKGELVDEYVDVDHGTRLTAAKTVAEMAGLFQKKAEEEKKGDTTYNILILAERMEGLTNDQLEEELARIELGLPQLDAPAIPIGGKP